jgi:hypothetical protein
MKFDSRVPRLAHPSIWLLLLLVLLPKSALASQPRLASIADYHRYIDPLLAVKDFKTSYVEDGAADATVLFPESPDHPYGRPAGPVIALVRLREKSIPLLIDCLSDGRITSMHFDGNLMTQPMNVPAGYVCLDILMGVIRDSAVDDPDDCGDGFGACIHTGFYFRPDDYTRCWGGDSCLLRPWVTVVQRNWRAQYLAHRLRFRNPYDDPTYADVYKDLTTPKK